MALDPASRSGDPDADPTGGTLTHLDSGGSLLVAEAPSSDAWSEGRHAPAVGPWRLAGRRLRRNKVALAFLALFIVLVAMCLLAPVYSHSIAQIAPNTNNVTGTINVNGHSENVVSLDGVPIGPTF